MEVKLIPLHYRSAQSIIPMIKPIMPQGSVINGKGHNLIVKTTPKNYQEIIKLVKHLDVAKKMLRITVRQSSTQDIAEEGTGLYKPEFYHTTSSDEEKDVQHIQVLDGQTAFISAGQSIPIVQYYGYDSANPYGGITYHDIKTGFYVTPKIYGNKVTLSINKQRQDLDRFGQGRINKDEAETTMTVPFGKWVNLGGTEAATRYERAADNYQTGDRRIDSATLFVKVDLMATADYVPEKFTVPHGAKPLPDAKLGKPCCD